MNISIEACRNLISKAISNIRKQINKKDWKKAFFLMMFSNMLPLYI
jgi:hypothetical protein